MLVSGLARQSVMPRLLLSLFALSLASSLGADPPRPNVLLIMADDLGFSDLGCYGAEIATPNLDAVAGSGLRFTQFYNTARCWPTRGSLLTGYYAQQIRRDTLPGVPSGGGNRGLRPEWAELLPKRLKPAGYRSYHTGKWHIDGMPLENGFDHSYYLRDQGRFFNPTKHWKDDQPLPPVPKGTDFYATTALADHAIEVLKDHAEHHAESPFLHYLAFAAPHFPLHALPEDIALYDDVYQVGWDVIRQRRWRRQQELGLWTESSGVVELSRVERDLGPPYHFPEALEILGSGEVNKPIQWKSLSEGQQAFQAKKMAIHAAMIHRMDLEIGRVFDQIREMGEWDNTLVIFLSDNGASAEIMVRDDGHDPALPAGAADTYLCLGPGWSTTCNTPFRRHKTWTHEGGTATPFIVSWPAGLPAAGEFRRTPGHVIDVVPTLLELAGAERHPEAPSFPGQSLVGNFEVDGTTSPETLWWFHDGHRAIRWENWKAVSSLEEPWELYDLSKDRDESSDLAVPQRQVLEELVSAWERQRDAFIELATADLDPAVLKKAREAPASGRPNAMKTAQEEARPKRRQVLINGESFRLNNRHAFLMSPETPAQTSEGKKPWIFYGPTLVGTPDKAESAMHRRFLDAGIAVAGIDVGEAYGSPAAFPYFEALYQHMISQGYAAKPALLGRSRGGLWVSSWALAHPQRVAGIGGIYPVYDYTSYPGIERAASAYGMTPAELEARQAELNPVKRAHLLAKAGIPVCIIHGTIDKVVPFDRNSAALAAAYEAEGKRDLVELIEIDDQGHNYWPGFFNCEALIDFLIARARGAEF